MLFFIYQQKKAAKAEDNSDDEIPDSVDLQDPYFAEELSKQGRQINGMIYSCWFHFLL